MNLPVPEMLRSEGKWFSESGALEDSILSTRVRLARNLRGMRFPPRALAEELSAVGQRVSSTLGRVSELAGASLHAMQNLSALERQFLLERHLASHELASDGGHRALAFTPDEGRSVMVNEEDHLRIQSLCVGFQLDRCYAQASTLDDQLDAELGFAFSDDLGYLTACPTNVGTGMRASVLIHLPALVLTQKVKKVLVWVTQAGLAVRGFYGEGTDVLGNFFQISNQITLGEKETQTLLNLERAIHQVLENEAKARELLVKEAGDQIRDKIERAYGVLRYAHLLSSREMIGLVSALRLGISLELPGLPSIRTINAILLHGQAAHLQIRMGREMSSQERNRARAEFVRAQLAGPGDN